MQSRWNDAEAKQLDKDPLKLRVYTSRLLGQEEDLVLHGGGNTSVKTKVRNVFGEEEDIIYVKGSGWDLATIEAPGFPPVRLEVLKKMAALPSLTDEEMVKLQRAAMTDPFAPTPSVEAVLHAIIPFAFVDHTHADAVVTITNTPGGEEKIRQLYGERMLVVPYVMPGFILAKTIHNMTQGLDWSQVDGMILMNHGVFTFDDDARRSYEKMIAIVTKAEDYIAEKTRALPNTESDFKSPPELPRQIAVIRQAVSKVWGKPVLVRHDSSEASLAFSNLSNVADIATRGCLTPDHSISTKRTPAILDAVDPASGVEKFRQNYAAYFQKNNDGTKTMLDPAPRWAVVPGLGTLAFGPVLKATQIVQDISRHTMKAIRQAEQLGGWQALPEKDLFDVEYWSLEQAKLKKAGAAPPMSGKVALVTGAASGIGKACVERLLAAGAVVAALDVNPAVVAVFSKKEVLGIACDVTDVTALQSAIEKTVLHFGGLDMVVSNAGIFTKSMAIGETDEVLWQKSMAVNLTSHRQLLQACLPYLELGESPAVVVIGSKNVPAPGPGAAAYSVAKAGLTQLARIAALEFGKKGIRVNVLHPNAVYDTAIWTDEVLQARAAHYGQSVEQYKTSNVLGVEVTSGDVAELAVLMLGSVFSKVTGAQLPVDGGNERVI
jgi:rhamnose utilization protein RhaD (predicted bifunctional aldolase and dehydrogenase)/NAD(P)-dependent dehydrogenase (short-subunit alcohol dehydrogenase family)